MADTSTSSIVSRVKQKTGTLSEWKSVWNSFIPLRGEQCVIIIPANSTDGESLGFTKSSEVRHVSKTGDGTSTIKNLPWDHDVTNIYKSITSNTVEINKLIAQLASSVKIFVGTLAEYQEATNNELISVGTLVCLTDDDIDSLEAVLVNGILTPGSLPSLSEDRVLQARSLPTLTKNGTLIF